MMSFVQGKVALVTGGAMGCGYEFAKALFSADLKGAAIVDFNETVGNRTVAEFNKEFGAGKAIFIKADVTNSSQLESAFQKTVDTFKQLDIVINNAGILDDVNYRKMIDINLVAVVNSTFLALEKYLPAHKSGNEGLIINNASILGLNGCASIPVYSSTKHAVVGLTKSLGMDYHYERTKIRVIAICPGVTVTPLITEVNVPKAVHYPERFKFDFKHLVEQDAAEVGKGLMKAIEKGKSGSVWVIEGSEPAYEVEFLERKDMRKKTS